MPLDAREIAVLGDALCVCVSANERDVVKDRVGVCVFEEENVILRVDD